MNNSYLIRVNVDYDRLMMIAVELLNVAVDFHHDHDFDPVINALLNHVDHVMHYLDLNYHDVPDVHLHHRLVLKLVVNLFDYSTANKIHRMPSLVAVIAVNVVVPDSHANLVDSLGHTVSLNLYGLQMGKTCCLKMKKIRIENRMELFTRRCSWTCCWRRYTARYNCGRW